MKSATSFKSKISRMMTLMLSLLLISAAQLDLHAQAPAPAYVELDATQLDQLVAPIALNPDSLVAQILTASTYPDQVSDADTWLNQHMNQPPDQRAAGANNMSWDPAVKGLIEFPAELDMLVKNSAWTAQIGNAYYNQPGDVMNAVQAMRLQAQQSNVLVTTAQQRVVVEAGVIEIVPVNPAVIFVPYYNPWQIWGTLFVAYPGFVVLPPPPGIVWAAGLAFDPGIAVGVYAGYGWGFGAWAPAWDGGTVLFNNSTYISNSVTVVNHGYFGGHDRGAFEHGGRGVPNGYRACAHAGAARARAGRATAGRGNYGKPSAGRSNAGRGGMGASHSASAGRTASSRGASSHGATTASRGGSSFGHGSTTANRGSSANRGSATASRNGASVSRGSSTANRNTTASRGGASANRSSATANRGTASANRNTTASRGGTSSNRSSASANRSAAANHGAASANRSSAAANHGTASANRSSSAANHGSASASRGAATANRGGASSSHSGGGHASSGRGKGR